MNQEHQKKLEGIKGQALVYEDKVYHFTHYNQITSGNIIIYADERTFNLFPSELDDFIEKLEPYTKSEQNLPVKTPSKKDDFVFVPPSENESLKQTLLETLNELKGQPSKEAMEKSKGIVNVVNSIIDIQKTEVALYNIQARIHKKRLNY